MIRLNVWLFGAALQGLNIANESTLTQPGNFDLYWCVPVNIEKTLSWRGIRRFRKEVIDLPC